MDKKENRILEDVHQPAHEEELLRDIVDVDVSNSPRGILSSQCHPLVPNETSVHVHSSRNQTSHSRLRKYSTYCSDGVAAGPELRVQGARCERSAPASRLGSVFAEWVTCTVSPFSRGDFGIHRPLLFVDVGFSFARVLTIAARASRGYAQTRKIATTNHCPMPCSATSRNRRCHGSFRWKIRDVGRLPVKEKEKSKSDCKTLQRARAPVLAALTCRTLQPSPAPCHVSSCSCPAWAREWLPANGAPADYLVLFRVRVLGEG